MARIERTPLARADLVDIWAYIADDNVEAADRLIDDIANRFDSLAKMPQSGEAVPYIAPDIRRSSVGNYVIYYRPLSDGVTVLRVLHGARQPKDLL